MGFILIAIGGLLSLAATVCFIIVLIAAFQDEIWKGLVGLFCCQLYLLYYGFCEFQHEKKGLILAGWLLGGIFGSILTNVGLAMLG